MFKISSIKDMPDSPYKHRALKNSLQKAHERLWLTGDPPNGILLTLPDSVINDLHILLNPKRTATPDLSLGNWDSAIQTLSSHGVLPLLYHALYGLPEVNRPTATAMKTLRAAFQTSSLSVISQARQLKILLSAMNQAGEKFLVLKGPSLSGTFYPLAAMRPCHDIDILVLPERFHKVREILSSLGYRCKAERFDRYRDLHSEEGFGHPSDRTLLPVELHWDIHHYYGFRKTGTVKAFFERAVSKSFEGILFDGLDLVDELIHLSLHMILIHTRDIRLIWLYDIHLLSDAITRMGKWDELQKRCGEWSATLPVFHALQLTRIWTGLTLPETMNGEAFFRDIDVQESIQWEKILTRTNNIRDMIALRLPPFLPFWKKTKYLIDFAIPPVENIRKRYAVSHDFLIPFFYVRRFFDRLVRRSWKS